MANYLIVGASSGIGFQLAIQLSEQGHTVYGTYCDHVAAHDNIRFQQLDVLKDDIVLELPDKLDGVVYCPGSIQLKPFNRISPSDFSKDHALNVVGAVKVLQKALPALKNSEQASVVLISTVAVQTGLAFHSLVSSSKGALEGLTRALAAEWAPRIRVNCIAPSLTNTPLAEALLNTPEKTEAGAARHPLKRIGKPEDIANCCEFLLSPASGWITGQVMAVDGGMSALRTS